METEQKLFELIHAKGETLEGNIHIIDTSGMRSQLPGEYEYRVYHADGYCFDIRRVLEETGLLDTDEFDYSFYAEWDGFKDLTPKKAIELINTSS